MNYVLLGLIIETIEGQPLAQSIRNRILVLLKMENTYFEFYEPPVNKGNIQHQWIGKIDFSKLNTSFDWAGGGLVSTNQDLAVFIKALFENKLISKSSLKKLLDVQPAGEGENRYGLGIYETDYNGKTFYGHYGFYGTYVGYCPEDKTVLSYSIGQAMPGFFVYDFVSQVLKQAE
jgi:D-alanyl-D-alanine carboxypeptidase